MTNDYENLKLAENELSELKKEYPEAYADFKEWLAHHGFRCGYKNASKIFIGEMTPESIIGRKVDLIRFHNIRGRN